MQETQDHRPETIYIECLNTQAEFMFLTHAGRLPCVGDVVEVHDRDEDGEVYTRLYKVEERRFNYSTSYATILSCSWKNQAECVARYNLPFYDSSPFSNSTPAYSIKLAPELQDCIEVYLLEHPAWTTQRVYNAAIALFLLQSLQGRDAQVASSAYLKTMFDWEGEDERSIKG